MTVTPSHQRGFALQPLFDGQAEAYERRAALPGDVGRAVARSVLSLSGAGAGDLVLEVGAGTGLIGRHLVEGAPAYIGFDIAADMLAVFAGRLGGDRSRGLLTLADGDRQWPIAAGAARAIFSSRALHLLPLDHVVRQVARVGCPAGTTLVIGRLRFAADGIRDRMARAMRTGLRRRGQRPRGGQRLQRRLIETLCQDGWRPIERQQVAAWSVLGTPRRALEDWRGKPGLGGIRPPKAIKQAVLAEVEAWAHQACGDLDRPFETEVAYTLEGVHRPTVKGA